MTISASSALGNFTGIATAEQPSAAVRAVRCAALAQTSNRAMSRLLLHRVMPGGIVLAASLAVPEFSLGAGDVTEFMPVRSEMAQPAAWLPRPAAETITDARTRQPRLEIAKVRPVVPDPAAAWRAPVKQAPPAFSATTRSPVHSVRPEPAELAVPRAQELPLTAGIEVVQLQAFVSPEDLAAFVRSASEESPPASDAAAELIAVPQVATFPAAREETRIDKLAESAASRPESDQQALAVQLVTELLDSGAADPVRQTELQGGIVEVPGLAAPQTAAPSALTAAPAAAPVSVAAGQVFAAATASSVTAAASSAAAVAVRSAAVVPAPAPPAVPVRSAPPAPVASASAAPGQFAASVARPLADPAPRFGAAMVGLEINTRLTTRVDGKVAGAIDIRQTESALMVRLGSIAEVLGDRFSGSELRRITSSSASEMYLSIAQLQAQGIPISYDPVYDEFNIGHVDTRPANARKVHIDQIGAPERGARGPGMDQVGR